MALKLTQSSDAMDLLSAKVDLAQIAKKGGGQVDFAQVLRDYAQHWLALNHFGPLIVPLCNNSQGLIDHFRALVQQDHDTFWPADTISLQHAARHIDVIKEQGRVQRLTMSTEAWHSILTGYLGAAFIKFLSKKNLLDEFRRTSAKHSGPKKPGKGQKAKSLATIVAGLVKRFESSGQFTPATVQMDGTPTIEMAPYKDLRAGFVGYVEGLFRGKIPGPDAKKIPQWIAKIDDDQALKGLVQVDEYMPIRAQTAYDYLQARLETLWRNDPVYRSQKANAENVRKFINSGQGKTLRQPTQYIINGVLADMIKSAIMRSKYPPLPALGDDFRTALANQVRVEATGAVSYRPAPISDFVDGVPKAMKQFYRNAFRQYIDGRVEQFALDASLSSVESFKPVPETIAKDKGLYNSTLLEMVRAGGDLPTTLEKAREMLMTPLGSALREHWLGIVGTQIAQDFDTHIKGYRKRENVQHASSYDPSQGGEAGMLSLAGAPENNKLKEVIQVAEYKGPAPDPFKKRVPAILLNMARYREANPEANPELTFTTKDFIKSTPPFPPFGWHASAGNRAKMSNGLRRLEGKSGHNEWIPCDLIPVILQRATQSPKNAAESVVWVLAQHMLRVETAFLIFKPGDTAFDDVVHRLKSQGLTLDDLEKEQDNLSELFKTALVELNGHPGALYIPTGGKPPAKGKVATHPDWNTTLTNMVEALIQRGVPLEDVIDDISDFAADTVWNGTIDDMPPGTRKLFDYLEHVKAQGRFDDKSGETHKGPYSDAKGDTLKRSATQAIENMEQLRSRQKRNFDQMIDDLENAGADIVKRFKRGFT